MKVQSLGARLVWQLYLRNPGTGLARSKFVHYLDGSDIATPDNPPGLRPKPASGQDTGTTTTLLYDTTKQLYCVTLVVRTTADRQITAVSIDTITDLEGAGRTTAPRPR